MAVCIPKEYIEGFKKALKEKEIKMEDLFNLSTEELTKKLEPYAGKNTKDVVLLFEQKRILKNRLLGMKNAVSKVGEFGKYDKKRMAEAKKALDEFKATQTERILNPEETQNFYNSLADKILGTHVTEAQAKQVFSLQQKMEEIKNKITDETPEKSKLRIQYGARKYLLDKYVKALQNNLTPLQVLKEFGISTKEAFKADTPTAIADLLAKTWKSIADLSVSIVASWDASFMGRQGLNTLKTHPTIWWNMAKNNIGDFYKTVKGQDAEGAFFSSMYGRKNYMNGEYEKAGLVPKAEEAVPIRVQEMIPGIGRIFKGADVAFIDSALRARFDIFDLLKKKALDQDVKWNDAQVKDIGTLVNSLTARGKWGKRGEPAVIRAIFWAPRMLKAHIDVLTAHSAGTGLKTEFARKEARLNLVKIIGTNALIMVIANAMVPGSAETDPRSSNFGKVKIGNTTFDYTGGAGSLAVLASRLIKKESKSSSTGVVTKYGSGFGKQTRMDAIINFAEGKTTPIINNLIQLAKGRTYQGTKATLGTSAYQAFTPIPLQNAIQAKDDASVDAVLGVILDLGGINANTRQLSTTNWDLNPTNEMKQFKTKIGSDKFVKANRLYNKKMSAWIATVKKNPKFKKLSEDSKKLVITAKRRRVKEEIFRSYSFRPARVRRARAPRL